MLDRPTDRWCNQYPDNMLNASCYCLTVLQQSAVACRVEDYFRFLLGVALGILRDVSMGLLLYAGVGVGLGVGGGGGSTNAASKAGVLLLLPDVCGPGSYNYWIVLA